MYLFIVDKRKIIKLPTDRAASRVRGAFVVDVFDKLEGLLVSVDEGEGIVLRVDCQKLWGGREESSDDNCQITQRLHFTVINTHLLILFISNITREATKLWLPAYGERI